jgi:hypothetical protein
MRLAAAAMLSGFLGGWACPLSAAEVLLDWKGNDAGIVIDGPITSETSYQVGWAITEIRERKGELLAYVLNSPGGSVAAALDIASSVRDTGKPVMVLSGSVCASACFLLLAAGQDKAVSQDALIGIHSATSVGVGEDTAALAATATMARQAAAYGVPDALIGKLVRTPASGLARLSAVEIRSIPGAVVAQSVSYSGFVAHAVPVAMAISGYSAGAYIAAGLSSKKACDFPSPQFQAGCVRGLHDSPPRGWAGAYIRSRGASRP